MFQMLDAEFACILYDGERGEFLAARDPIGIRPLYYGYDATGAIVFASEPKNLVGLCEEIRPFPPGHYYAGREVRPLPRTSTTVDVYCLRRPGDRLRQHPREADRRRGEAAGRRRPAGLPPLRRAWTPLWCAPSAARKILGKPIRTFAIGMRHGRHRPEVRPGGGGLHRQPTTPRSIMTPGGGPRRPCEEVIAAAGHL